MPVVGPRQYLFTREALAVRSLDLLSVLLDAGADVREAARAAFPARVEGAAG